MILSMTLFRVAELGLDIVVRVSKMKDGEELGLDV